jgi:lipopolysaccharide export system permease protein
MTTEKWVKENDTENVALVIWSPLFILLPFGLFFLRQARNDSKVFDTDLYAVYWSRFMTFVKKKSNH